MTTRDVTPAAATTRARELPRPQVAERVTRMISRGALHVVLLTVAVIWLVPTLGLAVTSIRPRSDILGSGWWESLSTLRFTLSNYEDVLGSQGMGRAFVNSLIITVPTTIIPVLVGALAAYGFAWLRFPGRDVIFLLIVACMVIPAQTVFVPLLRLFRDAGLTKGFIGIWLVHSAAALPFAIFLLRNFFVGLPRELIEAARIDGASHLSVLRRVVLPLSVPALASLGIFQFLWVWNDLLEALIFVQSPDNQPLTVRMSQLLSTYGTEWHLLSAGAFILMIVPLAVFFSLQRYFVRGMLAGAGK